MAKLQKYYQFGDTWPVGGFTVKNPQRLNDIILRNFDVPCWPELYGDHDGETLMGFWVPLYQRWLDPTRSKTHFSEELSERPGIKELKKEIKGRPLQILKGQMIGPATLKWALLKHKLPMADDQHIVKFTAEAFVAQIQALSELALNVVISLDEPSAFLVPECMQLWKDFFHAIDMYRPFGVALHSCGDIAPQWLALPWQVVHFDAAEVLDAWEKEPVVWAEAWRTYFERGSWLASGLLSSSRIAVEPINDISVIDFFEKILPISNNQILFSTTCGIDAPTETDLEQRLSHFPRLTELAKTSRDIIKNAFR